jgi:hypothetical protein
MNKTENAYISLEDFAINVIISFILPPFDTTTVDVWGERKEFVARWTNLHSVAIRERNRQINCDSKISLSRGSIPSWYLLFWSASAVYN